MGYVRFQFGFCSIKLKSFLPLLFFIRDASLLNVHFKTLVWAYKLYLSLFWACFSIPSHALVKHHNGDLIEFLVSHAI